MRAIVYDAPRSFTVEELPEPRPAADEVRLRVEMTGVCGTDVHIHDGRFISRFPLTPGHEVVGVVDEVGAAVTAVRAGPARRRERQLRLRRLRGVRTRSRACASSRRVVLTWSSTRRARRL